METLIVIAIFIAVAAIQHLMNYMWRFFAKDTDRGVAIVSIIFCTIIFMAFSIALIQWAIRLTIEWNLIN